MVLVIATLLSRLVLCAIFLVAGLTKLTAPDSTREMLAGFGVRSGVLTVLALSYEVMPRAVQLFRQKHPQVLVHHQALHSPQIVSSLVLQEADIGYVFSAVPHPALTQESLGLHHVACVIPKGMLPARAVRRGSRRASRRRVEHRAATAAAAATANAAAAFFPNAEIFSLLVSTALSA